MDRPPTCRFYQTGECANGEFCTFSHPTQRCRNFITDGFCPYGLHCYYWHDNAAVSTPSRQSIQKVCRFFLNGQCVYGDACSYSHQIGDDDPDGATTLTLAEYKIFRARERRISGSISRVSGPSWSNPTSSPPVAPPAARPPLAKPTARLEQAYLNALQPGDLEKMKELEVDRLRKRFSSRQLQTVSTNEEGPKVFSLIYSSSDPDWSHKVKNVHIIISLPGDYPALPPSLNISQTPNLPPTLINHLNTSIAEWLADRQQSYASTNKVALYLRPFIFWFDKKLNQLFIDGYRLSEESGEMSQFTAAGQLSPTNHYFDTHEESSSETQSEEQSDVETTHNPPAGASGLSNAASDFPKSLQVATSPPNNAGGSFKLAPSAASVQQTLTLESVELRGHAGTCLFNRLPVFCSCGRCRYVFNWVFTLPSLTGAQIHKHPFESVAPLSSTCPRCRQSMGLNFAAALLPNLTGVIGTFGLVNCCISDLEIKSAGVIIHCINCSSDFESNGLVAGGTNTKRCSNCHSLCGVQFSDVNLSGQQKASERISQIFASLTVTQPAAVGKSRARPRNTQGPHTGTTQSLIIQKGTALPDNGACKHYKKSYRWLRFPCCNRAFPCDVCHDKEVSGAHETLYANRTICGFCSKEQPCAGGVQQQVCVACQQHLTGTRTAYWEGGRGCRDPTKMSRKDKRKYKNN